MAIWAIIFLTDIFKTKNGFTKRRAVSELCQAAANVWRQDLVVKDVDVYNSVSDLYDFVARGGKSK